MIINSIFDVLFGQYEDYKTVDIVLETLVFLFSIISACLALKNSFWLYPTGIISTSIFAYLLYNWGLIGDMIINIYYFLMSIYGWYLWTIKQHGSSISKISTCNSKDKRSIILIFFGAISFVIIMYVAFDKWGHWIAYVDTLTTGLFFVGMWLLAKHKIENWLFLLTGNIISVPLYFYKGYTLSSLLYVCFIIIAWLGYKSWKTTHLNKYIQT